MLDRYDKAAALAPEKIPALMRNRRVTPVWTGDGDTFWYRRESDDGAQFVLVDPVAATKTVAASLDELGVDVASRAGASRHPSRSRWPRTSSPRERPLARGRRRRDAAHVRRRARLRVGSAVCGQQHGRAVPPDGSGPSAGRNRPLPVRTSGDHDATRRARHGAQAHGREPATVGRRASTGALVARPARGRGRATGIRVPCHRPGHRGRGCRSTRRTGSSRS